MSRQFATSRVESCPAAVGAAVGAYGKVEQYGGRTVRLTRKVRREWRKAQRQMLKDMGH